jgi:Na+-driven multidrug efflux pump
MDSSFCTSCCVGLHQIAVPLTLLLRMGSTTAVALQTLTFGLPFIALQQVSSGVLQGMGHSLRPVSNTC